MKQTKMKSNSAFTLVEILVATVVFALFLTSLFSLYRMGSRMYLSGGWRLQKQKDTERFLNSLKEKMEQGSGPVNVLADGTLFESPGQLGVISSGTYTFNSDLAAASPDTTLLNSTTLLSAFPLCKPAIRQNEGLIMYNILRARKSPIFEKLMILEFLSTNTIDSGAGQDFVTGSSFSFFTGSPPDLTRFSGNAQTLGAAPLKISLEDVLSVSITIPQIPAGLVASDSLLRIDIELQHPKYPQTRVSHSMTTSIEIPVVEGGL